MRKIITISIIALLFGGFVWFKTRKRRGQSQPNVTDSRELNALYVSKNPSKSGYDNVTLIINSVTPITAYVDLTPLTQKYDVYQIVSGNMKNVVLFPKGTKFENGKSYSSYIVDKDSLSSPKKQYTFVYGSAETTDAKFTKFEQFDYLIGVKSNSMTVSLYVSNDPNCKFLTQIAYHLSGVCSRTAGYWKVVNPKK